MSLHVAAFFHPDSHTFSYVVHDPATRQAAVIDPVLDYDPDTDALGEAPLQPLLAHVAEAGLEVRWLLETHAHADHLSAGRRLKQRWPDAALAMGEGIVQVQRRFAPRYALDVPTDGSQFDRLFADGEAFAVGGIDAEVMAVPGHTPDSVAYRIGDALFTGDSLFMPDGGTARCDFPGGDAAMLYRSIQRLLALPDATRVFICHDYGPGGREVANETTIGEQKESNIHLRDGVAEEAFVATREARDATLDAPKLLHPSVKANLQGGPE